MLEELASNLWVATSPLRFLGLAVGTRMTVVRLQNGELFVHSPLALDDTLRGELDALGEVRYIVAPNLFHHLFAGTYGGTYPRAHLFVAPGLERKRPDLAVEGILGDQPRPEWAGEISQCLFRGYPLMNEVVFYHAESRTVILSDLAFNMGAEQPPMTRCMLHLLRAYGHFGPSVVERLFIRDRPAAAESLRRILEWNFHRVVLAHGKVLEQGGPGALRDGYAWLLKA